jgi:hypothetical protein
MTVAEWLEKAQAADASYEWRNMDGVIVWRTPAQWRDPDDVLNRSIGAIELTDVTVDEALTAVCMPPRSFPRQKPLPSARFSLRFRGGTLLEAINAVVRAYGDFTWFVTIMPDQTPARLAGHFPTEPINLEFEYDIGRFAKK